MRLAVAVVQAAEDAEDFQVALQGHVFEVAVEGVDVRVDRQADLLRALPVAHHPVEHEFLVPLDVGVAQQRGEVVGDRAEHGVLEVQHARVALVEEHQVAGMEIAVHEHLLLGQHVGGDRLEHLVELGALLVVHRDAQVASDEPLREQVHFAQHEGAVEFRQHAGLAAAAGT